MNETNEIRQMDDGNQMAEIDSANDRKETVNTKQPKKLTLGIVIGVVAVLLIAIGFYNSPAQRIARQISLGYKYLEKQQYDEAIVAFNNTIEIEPNCLEAYAAGLEAYKNAGRSEELKVFYESALMIVKSMDTNILVKNQEHISTIYINADEVYENEYEKTTQILEEGLVLIENNEEIEQELISQYKELVQQYTQQEKYADSLEVYERLVELGGTDKQVLKEFGDCIILNVEQLVQEKKFEEAKALVEKYKSQEVSVNFDELMARIEEQERKEAEKVAFMQKVYDLMAAENYSAMCEVDSFEEAETFVEQMEEEKYIYIPGDNTSLNGMGAGVYKFDEGGYYFFYGNYTNGIRTGQGTAFEGSNMYQRVFIGEWQNDAPNGFGRELIEGETYTTCEGNLKDGLWDGNIKFIFSMDIFTFDFSFTAANGVPTEDKTEEFCEQAQFSRSQLELEDGAYIFAYDIVEVDDENGKMVFKMSSSIKDGQTIGTIGYGDWQS